MTRSPALPPRLLRPSARQIKQFFFVSLLLFGIYRCGLAIIKMTVTLCTYAGSEDRESLIR